MAVEAGIAFLQLGGLCFQCLEAAVKNRVLVSQGSKGSQKDGRSGGIDKNRFFLHRNSPSVSYWSRKFLRIPQACAVTALAAYIH